MKTIKAPMLTRKSYRTFDGDRWEDSGGQLPLSFAPTTPLPPPPPPRPPVKDRILQQFAALRRSLGGACD